MASVLEPCASDALRGRIDTAAIDLSWSEAPWDSAVFGYPVVQISRI